MFKFKKRASSVSPTPTPNTLAPPVPKPFSFDELLDQVQAMEHTTIASLVASKSHLMYPQHNPTRIITPTGDDVVRGRGFSEGSLSEPLSSSRTNSDYQDRLDELSLEESEAKCSEVVRAFMMQERAFVRGLRRLCVQFLRPIREYALQRQAHAPGAMERRPSNNATSSVTGSMITGERPEVTEEDAAVIAGCSENLLKLHEDLLSRMEERDDDWEEATQGLSDIFLDLLPRFGLHRRYARNHPTCLATLDWLARRASGFARFLESRSQDAMSKDRANLLAYLVLPIQRALKYPHFLKVLVHYLPAGHPDYDRLKMCSEKYERELLTPLQQELYSSEDRLRLLDVQANVHGLREPVALTKQRLVHIGKLTRLDPVTKEPEWVWLLLLDDCALWAREVDKRIAYRDRQKLKRVTVTEVADGEGYDGTFAFQVDGWVHILLASSPDDKKEWIHQICLLTSQEVKKGSKESRKAIQRAKEAMALKNVERMY
jgi:hypothetical protein